MPIAMPIAMPMHMPIGTWKMGAALEQSALTTREEVRKKWAAESGGSSGEAGGGGDAAGGGGFVAGGGGFVAGGVGAGEGGESLAWDAPATDRGLAGAGKSRLPYMGHKEYGLALT